MLEIGDQVVLDNGHWAIVDEVNQEDNTVFVVDKDGQDYEVSRDGSGCLAIKI